MTKIDNCRSKTTIISNSCFQFHLLKCFWARQWPHQIQTMTFNLWPPWQQKENRKLYHIIISCSDSDISRYCIPISLSYNPVYGFIHCNHIFWQFICVTNLLIQSKRAKSRWHHRLLSPFIHMVTWDCLQNKSIKTELWRELTLW